VNIIVQEVPDSRLRKYPVPVTEKVLPYVKEKCQYGYYRLDSLLIIQSPALNLTVQAHESEKQLYLLATDSLPNSTANSLFNSSQIFKMISALEE